MTSGQDWCSKKPEDKAFKSFTTQISSNLGEKCNVFGSMQCHSASLTNQIMILYERIEKF